MRRLYRRRADTLVFATVAAVSVGVLVAYFEMQDREAPPESAVRDDAPQRLLVLRTDDPATILLETDALETMPLLSVALEEAAEVGSATVRDAGTIDAIWFQLAESYGVAPHAPVVVGHQEAQYRLQMTR